MLSGSKNVSVSIFLVEWEARELKSAKRMSKLAPMQIVSAVLLTWAVSTAQSVAGEAAKANCVSGDCNAGYGKMGVARGPTKRCMSWYNLRGLLQKRLAERIRKARVPVDRVHLFWGV